jgi:hypothetical protein
MKRSLKRVAQAAFFLSGWIVAAFCYVDALREYGEGIEQGKVEGRHQERASQAERDRQAEPASPTPRKATRKRTRRAECRDSLK